MTGICAAALAACQPAEESAGGAVSTDPATAETYAGIAPDDMIRFIGTEPFWGGSVTGTSLTWTTPEGIEGQVIAVSRFAGNGGLGFSGTLGGEAFDLMITPGACSDGMSDRTYPFYATVKLGEQQLSGCGWREGDDLGDAP